MSEIDWDNLDDEGVVDFKDTEELPPITVKKVEPPAKPKTSGFNINFRDLEDVVSALTAAEMQLLNNLTELKKLDNLAAKATSLAGLDTDAIIKRLDSVSFAKVEQKIIKNIDDRFNNFTKELNLSSSAAVNAAQELSKKAENLRLASDSLLQIDNMADDLQIVASSIKKWRIKNMYAAIGLSLFFGLLSGVFVSNLDTIFQEESIINASLLTPKFGKIAVLPDKKDYKTFYFAFGAKELSPQVETLEQDGVRYIKFQSQK